MAEAAPIKLSDSQGTNFPEGVYFFIDPKRYDLVQYITAWERQLVKILQTLFQHWLESKTLLSYMGFQNCVMI